MISDVFAPVDHVAPHVEKRSEKTGKLVLGQCSGSFCLLVFAL